MHSFMFWNPLFLQNYPELSHYSRGALDQNSDGGVRTGNGKTHPPIQIFSEIRPISTDFLTNIFANFLRIFALIGQLLGTATKTRDF